MATDSSPPEKKKPISLRDFFEKVQPGRWVSVESEYAFIRADVAEVELPLVELHCSTDDCSGFRFFEPTRRLYPKIKVWTEHFITYRCRNCKKLEKVYAIRSVIDSENGFWLFKFGEDPAFGPPTPARVITLVGAEKDYYLKGRRAELQGLGIGAFAYYRRVIENQKDKIFDEIIRVSERLNASKELLDDLAAAKEETQFSKAVEAVKHGIPQVLLLNGQNPLTLLHSALSEGLHAQTDEKCLELATSIRVILTEFVERVATALKDEAELNKAVNRLIQERGQKVQSDKDD
jgi:hypothetical protein